MHIADHTVNWLNPRRRAPRFETRLIPSTARQVCMFECNRSYALNGRLFGCRRPMGRPNACSNSSVLLWRQGYLMNDVVHVVRWAVVAYMFGNTAYLFACDKTIETRNRPSRRVATCLLCLGALHGNVPRAAR